MARYDKGLWALLLVLLVPIAALAGGASPLSGSLELGGAAVDLRDDSAKVNEYTSIKNSDGANGVGKFDLRYHPGSGVVVEADGAFNGGRDQQADALIDLHRIFKGKLKYNVLEHRLDHDRLDYMDAAVVRGGMNKTTHAPVALTGVSPDLVPAFILVRDNLDGTQSVLYGSDTGDFSSVAGPNDYVVQTGGASVYSEDLTPEQAFSITRKEWQADSELTLPALPNLTFELGYRQEKREGMEQAIGMSKCSGCHVTGEAKQVDETTEDFTAGATAKLGLLTLRYEFSDRKFDTGNDPSRYYDPVIKPGQPFNNATFDNRMTYDYDDGALSYDTTPESEKQSHLVKAKVDLAQQTSLLGSYVTSKVESSKTDEPGIFTLNRGKLTTSYDGYGFKAISRLTDKLKVSARVKLEEVDTDDTSVTYQTITAPTAPTAGLTFDASNTGFYTSDLEASGSKEVLTARLDASYRLAKRTTLRLKYQYEAEERDEQELGETTSHTYKASINSRPLRKLSLRASYSFQDIDNPFHNPDAAMVPVTADVLQSKFGVPGYIVGGDSDLYGTSFYAAREADLSNQPDQVHEFKLASTWSPKVNWAATLTYRFKDEENDLNRSSWEQQTHSAGASMWYAPSEKLNLTFAYNYFDQRNKTAFCQGFYDG